MNRTIKNTIITASICISITSLQGCIIGEGCAAKPAPIDQGKIYADPDWIEKNADKNAFDFECTGNVYPPSSESDPNGNVTKTIGFLVKEVYKVGVSIAHVRADALAKATKRAIDLLEISSKDAAGKALFVDVQNMNCKEKFMETPNVIGLCTVSDNSDNNVELPPGGEPPPMPSPASIKISAPKF